MLEKIANKLLPLATKLSTQRHLSAVKDSFIISMPLVMAASMFILLNALAVNFFKTDIFSGLATVVNQGTLFGVFALQETLSFQKNVYLIV